MIGIITLFIALSVQIGVLVYQLATGNRQTKVKHIVRLIAFAIFTFLFVTGVYWWGFRWIGLLILLVVQAISSSLYLIRVQKAERPYRRLHVILSCMTGCLLFIISILPGILFPQFQPIAPTGSYAVDTISVTLIDDERVEPLSKTGESRKLTIQFWYPVVGTGSDTFPLIVFSHGSFGYRGSNQSTFEDLASNGYVVCSVDHSYHSFFTKHTDGSIALVNRDFFNDAINITNNIYDKKTTYAKTHEWLALRTADMEFVLDEILDNKRVILPEPLNSIINTDKIGLFGHSLGGAAAAQLGRERNDVNAVIVVDGTMIGEEIGFENGQTILTTQTYPIPILNLYNESHYNDARQLGKTYNNLSASSNAVEAYDVVIRDSGHLNFTDLTLFSPILARTLGTGKVDSRYCIETMNHIILEFFDSKLKDSEDLHLQPEY